jgi:hypothetical protein
MKSFKNLREALTMELNILTLSLSSNSLFSMNKALAASQKQVHKDFFTTKVPDIEAYF